MRKYEKYRCIECVNRLRLFPIHSRQISELKLALRNESYPDFNDHVDIRL